MPRKPTDAGPLVLTEAQGDAHIGACEPLSSQGSSRASHTLNMSPPSFYSGKHFRHTKCADPLTVRMEGEREMEATEEEGLVSWLWARQHSPFPPAWGVGWGRHHREENAGQPRPQAPAWGLHSADTDAPCRTWSQRAASPVLIPTPGKSLSSSQVGGQAVRGGLHTGFPSSRAGGGTPGLSQGPRSRRHLPREPWPLEEGGPHTVHAAVPPGYKATRHHGTQGSRKGPRSSLCTPNTGRA